ncbi:hypothetical protein [Actinoplanes sp. NPDC026619]|uniref:hypothetical protein n=1 Tax=Actinoplanes sp. NPDC026619 TaxID=3155798 RepID=UPI0033BFF065
MAVAGRRTPEPVPSPVEQRAVRSHRHILVTVGVALLASGVAMMAGAWWAGRDGDTPETPRPTASDTSPSSPVPTDPAPSTPAGPRPDRSGPRSILMRPYEIPQNNYDPRTDKLFPADTAAITFECRRRTPENDIKAGCRPDATPVFTMAPNKKLEVEVAEVPPAAASRGLPMACDGLNYDDNPDFVLLAEEQTYCVRTDDWVAVIRIEDLPEKITSASPAISVQVSYWRR